MPLVLNATTQNISTPNGDTGTYTWADIEALGSTKLTAYANGTYQWRGIIDISATATLNISEKTIELFGADIDNPGIIRATFAGKVNFGETQTVDGKPVYVKGCNLTIRRSFTTGYPRPDLAALGYASGDERYSIGSRLNLYASRVNLSTTISTRIDIFISSAYASIFSYNNSGTGCYAFVQNGGDLTDCLFDRTNIEFLDYYSNFSGCKSHLGQNAIVFYSGFSSYSRRDIVRNFSPIGAEADYYIEARNALTFINSPDVNLSKGKIDDYGFVSVQAETFKAVEYFYKLVDSNGAVSGAEIRFTGFQTLTEVTDAAGSAPAFALVVERTDIVGTGTRNPPTPIVGTASYTRSIKSYQHLAELEPLTIDSPVGSATQPFAYGMTVDAGVTETNTATVSGYAGITNDISAYTLSGTLNLNQVYDSRKFYWRNTVGAPAPTRLGECAVFGSDITIASPANNPATTAKYTEVKTTGSLILSAAGDYSATRWLRDSGTTTRVAAGITNLSGWQFTVATIDNASASPAIVLVDYNQIGSISTTSTGGGSISVRSNPVVFTGLPTAANANGRSADATLGIQDVSSGTWHTYDASSGSVSVSLSELATAPAYQLVVRADAIGWIRTPDSTIDADYSGTFNIANLFREIVDEDGDAMVGLGTQSVMDKITYNQSAGRFEIDSGAIDFFSALDKKEVLTSSQAGLTVFDSALVRQLNFIKNAYANLIQFPNPLTAAASATAATSPILTDFVVMRTGDPTADVFVHGLSSSAPGLSDRPEIRMGTTKFISASASGGSGATAIEIRQEIDNNSSKLATIESQTSKLTFTNTGRVDATTITIANNAITAVAIDTDAITSSGLAASAVTEIQSGLATQSSLSAIPTNPLLTSDTRLNNLNAPIGSIPTNPLLTSDVRLNNLNAPVGSIPTNPLLSSDTRLNNLNAPIGSIPVNPLLTTDERLVNLDGKISDRPTLVQIEASATLAKSSQIPPAPDNTGIAAIKAKTDAIVVTSGRVTAAIDDTLLAKQATVETVSTHTARVDALIENNGGDRFTPKALEAAPSGEGGGSSLTAEQIWSHEPRTITARPPGTASDTDVAAIKAKTDNLPASPASTADVQVTVDGGFTTDDRTTLETIPTLVEIEASTAIAMVSDLPPAPDNAAITAIRSKTDAIAISSGRVQAAIDTTLLAKEATVEALPTAAENADAVRTNLGVELGRINATIGSRATPDDVQVTVNGGFTTGDRTVITTIATQVDQLHELEGIDDPASAKDPIAGVPGYRRTATIRQTLTQNPDGSYTIAPEPPP